MGPLNANGQMQRQLPESNHSGGADIMLDACGPNEIPGRDKVNEALPRRHF
jgi:hypothetical protein